MYLAWEVLPLSLVILLFWHIPRTQKLLWGKFNAPYGNDIPTLAYAYDSDIRTRAINDGVRFRSAMSFRPPINCLASTALSVDCVFHTIFCAPVMQD